MKRGGLVAVALASVAVLLAACAPAKPPPPPPTDPHDVLVVGDSIAYSFGCVLGDSGGGAGPCPSPGGFSTQNEIVGGCTISGGTILLYNGLTTDTPGCGDWPTSWAAHADKFTPKVVIIATSGWEIMDRWSGGPNGVPDRQWGGTPGSGPQASAQSAYQSSLAGAINLFRSRGAKVIVSNSAYLNPPEPQFPPGTPNAPDFIIRAWYERYPVTNTNPPEPWQAPVAGLTYRPSKAKVEQFNNAITNVVSSFGDPGVVKFDFFKHFDPTIGGSPAYSDNICPPPNDGADPSTTCPGTALDARDLDGGHLTPSGGHSILAHYLVPCVEEVLAGDPPTSCS
ncbi:MAG TPA: hypothetical protein VKE97_09240 [Acidimicrobiia bacterium]|nr:hypothetical protein [Acidimicrobiia bacterium]